MRVAIVEGADAPWQTYAPFHAEPTLLTLDDGDRLAHGEPRRTRFERDSKRILAAASLHDAIRLRALG